jgi:hypothetical protein
MRVVSAGMLLAISDDAPVLAEVQARRVARPFRASAWTSGCAPEVQAFIAGWSRVPSASSRQRSRVGMPGQRCIPGKRPRGAGETVMLGIREADV